MAGRMVVIRFDDRDAANMFARNENVANQLGFEVMGIYVLPTKFCECPDRLRQNAKNWSRGKRTGLQLCVRCRRPSAFHVGGLKTRLQHHFGYDQREMELE
jgi:hypothetical protein